MSHRVYFRCITCASLCSACATSAIGALSPTNSCTLRPAAARSAALRAGRGARVGQAEASSRDGGGCTFAPVARLAKRDAGNVVRDASARFCCAVHIGHELRAQVIALILACVFGRSCLFVAPHPISTCMTPVRAAAEHASIRGGAARGAGGGRRWTAAMRVRLGLGLCEAGYISWRAQGPLWHVRQASRHPSRCLTLRFPRRARKKAGAALRRL